MVGFYVNVKLKAGCEAKFEEILKSYKFPSLMCLSTLLRIICGVILSPTKTITPSPIINTMDKNFGNVLKIVL